MFRCLNDGCPWSCGTRKSSSCAERLMAYGLGSLLLLALMITTLWGILSLREGMHHRNVSPSFERAAVSSSHVKNSSVRIPRIGTGLSPRDAILNSPY